MNRDFICLGKEGEGNHLAIRFDTAVWREAYPEADILLWVTPPVGEGYFASLTEQSGDAIWTVTQADTAHAGSGEIELILRDVQTGTTIKSATARTLVKNSPSHAEGGDPPEAHKPWWEKLLGMLRGFVRTINGIEPDADGNIDIEVIGGGADEEQVREIVDERLTEAKESGEFDGPPGPTGPAGADGKDGKKGETGDSGVRRSNTEPTDPAVYVWINPDGDAGDVIELIETITLDEAMAIERSAEPDGTPYSFKRIVLMFEVPTGSAVSSGNIYFYNGDTGVGMGYLAKKEASASTPYLLNDCTQDAGRWLGRYMGGWTGNGNGVYTNNENRRRWLQYKVADYPTITRVTIPTLPAGTKVDVWGVRA